MTIATARILGPSVQVAVQYLPQLKGTRSAMRAWRANVRKETRQREIRDERARPNGGVARLSGGCAARTGHQTDKDRFG